MSNTVIKVENLSKQYRLGEYGTGTISHDLNRWWHKVRGKEDPYLKIGEINDRTTKGKSDYAWALKDINFEVRQGEVLGIIGKNGAGKSTLLKLLSRVTAPTTGTIKAKGRIASLLEVGTGFHEELTGRENIFLNGAILGMTKREIRSKLDEIVAFSGTERYIDTPVKRYSSGMRVRLAFAVAAHLEPEILIVDEVLAVGDAEFQKKAIGKMQDISHGEGRTVLFVSHNMGAVKSLCNMGLMLSNGEVKATGGIDSIVNLYMTANTDSSVLLQNRKDRIGSGKLKFINVKTLDGQLKDTQGIIAGEELNIEVQFNKEETVNIKEVIFSISLTDEYGTAIAFFVSDEMGFKAEDGNDKILLNIPQLLLRAGKYSIELFASVRDTTSENFCDAIADAAYLDVLSSDFWKIGKVARPGKSALLNGRYISPAT